MFPIFIDIEASGLGEDSFPIEVACQFKQEAVAEVGVTHRADADVRVLKGVYRRAEQQT